MSENPPSQEVPILAKAPARGSAERLAWVMDEIFPFPGTRRRFGYDFLLGLVPGVGDFAALVLGLPILIEGIRHRLPLRVLLVMATNLLLDAVIGTVPIAGNIFDFFWKANSKNLLLLREPEALPSVMRQAGAWIAGLAALAFFLLLLMVWLLMALVRWYLGLFAVA
jgi:hypothetical protein